MTARLTPSRAMPSGERLHATTSVLQRTVKTTSQPVVVLDLGGFHRILRMSKKMVFHERLGVDRRLRGRDARLRQEVVARADVLVEQLLEEEVCLLDREPLVVLHLVVHVGDSLPEQTSRDVNLPTPPKTKRSLHPCLP